MRSVDAGIPPSFGVVLRHQRHHRGRKHDLLHRARRLLLMADERLDDKGNLDPRPATRKAKCATRGTPIKWTRYLHHQRRRHRRCVRCSPRRQSTRSSRAAEVRRPGRTFTKWESQIAAWHRSHVSNGPTEAINNLVKRVLVTTFGMTNFRNYRIRSVLYAGKPDWALRAITHAEIRSAPFDKRLHTCYVETKENRSGTPLTWDDSTDFERTLVSIV